MTCGRLILSLVFGVAALRGVAGVPFTSYAVELATCYAGDNSQTVADECVSVCQSVYEAQNCNRNAACTCSTAPPAVVNDCIQCHIRADESIQSRDMAFLVPSRLSAYAQVCGQAQASPTPEQPVVGELPASQNSTLERRAVIDVHCIFGLPDVATTGVAVLIEGQRRLWPFYVVVFAVLFCVVERWRRSHKLS